MKIGIYIDAANINLNGGYNMRYDVLKAYCTQEDVPLRMNTYVSFDRIRAGKDQAYHQKQNRYFSILRNFGYKVIVKDVKWFFDDSGNKYGKANADLDMAVDMLLQAQKLDKIYLLTGDGDFKRVVQALQNLGIRIEVIAFENISQELKNEADVFTSGYLIPNLLPMAEEEPTWGEENSRVRGICYHTQDKFGFMHLMNPAFKYEEVFFHISAFKNKTQPSLEQVYEFTLKKAPRGWQAEQIEPVNRN